MRKKYKIPLGTKVEIISDGCNYNGRVGTLGAKYPDGLAAHNVYFDKDEFNTFMDYEIIPVQNVITICNLEYETLKQVFNTQCFYNTDIIIIKQKHFSFEEIENAYIRHCNDLAAWAKGTYIINEEEDFDTENREDIIGLIGRMLDRDDAIEETLMWEQWWIEGLRSHCTKGSIKNRECYFNPEAEIKTIII